MKHRSNDVGRFALHAVAFAAACFWVGEASALGLGRLNVTSALGESLKAEVDVTSITPDEASSLAVKVAAPEAYRAAGVEYNNVLPSTQVRLMRRPDGRSFLRLSSGRAVLEPFVDVIIEATWSTGRLVREYTMLFDPPSARMAQAPAPATAPVVAPPPAASLTPVQRAAVAAAPAANVAPTPEKSRQSPARRTPPPVAAANTPETVRVKSGDTLFGIAGRTQRPGVSLDQMLVSLFRGNPQAFMGNNMNRMKAGAVLSVPTAEQASALPQSGARELIIAQSADFDAYRQRLAGNVAPAAQAAPNQQASGKVQAQVDDRKQAAATTPDRLTLSQGAKASAAEAADSRASAERDNKARLAELSRNVEDLKKLQSGAAPAGTPPAAPPATPAVPATAAAPASVPQTGPTVVAAAPTPAAVVAPALAPDAAPTLAPAVAPPPAPVVAEPTPTPAPVPDSASPGMLDSLLENPLVLPGAGLLVLLLLGYGIWRMRSRAHSEAGETSFLESRLQPDSFFGASGGQRIDTRDAATTNASSMSYSLSQLDAIGDVDPVAEADVYLAYGRDLQAEEILKEAMRSAPERMAVRSKLLEVYAKRRDLKSYELLATQMFNLTHGEGEEWAQAQALGLTIDPENSLYQSGGQPEEVRDAHGHVVSEPLGASTLPFTAPVGTTAFQPAADATLDAPDLNLDLGPETIPGIPAPAPLDDDATLPFTSPSPQRGPQVAEAPPPPADDGAIDFDLSELDTLSPITDDRSSAAEPLLDFGELDAGGAPTGSDELGGTEPMARKLELAEEFRQIGDTEGARDLLEEVIARSEGSLKAKAQGMLDQLE